jgi:glycosyltransferase involved in cell wall biosynthesis
VTINNRDSSRFRFVVLAPNEWAGTWMNRQHLFSRLGRSFRVIYSNGAAYAWQWREMLSTRKFLGHVETIDGVLSENPPSLMLRLKRWKWYDRIILSLHGRRLNRLVGSSGSQSSDSRRVVLYIFHPSYADYVDYVDHDILVYHAYDDFSTMGTEKNRHSEQERLLVKRADRIFTSSTAVQRKLQSLGDHTKVEFIPNGVDFSLYESGAFREPEYISHISHPRVCYIGSINPKVDFDTVEYLTQQHPTYSFIFVGRVNNLGPREVPIWGRICSKPNVHLIGPKPQADVPALLAHADVNCIYYVTSGDNFSSAGYPLKLHECLASGRPVVASNIESVREFSHVVLVAEDKEHWSKLLHYALDIQCRTDEATHRRVMVAKQNSWDDRVEKILTSLARI